VNGFYRRASLVGYFIELRIENEGNEEHGSDAHPVPQGRHFINRILQLTEMKTHVPGNQTLTGFQTLLGLRGDGGGIFES
jgi:hypothetical protein